ncbi:MAG: hypothetical protein EOO94_03900, partial [Pedobacter sp.]
MLKRSIALVFTCLMVLQGSTSLAQDEQQQKLDLPGDNLNLYAVLKIFQESETLEAFERKLNSDTNQVNNLDLDGDNNVDYIRVMDYPEGDVHNITLKVALNKSEDQDLAVIVVRKLGDNRVDIQVIGDEDLYGKDYIIEPNMADDKDVKETPNPGYTGTVVLDDGETVNVQTITTYQVATWPVVRTVFVPGYVVWRSPWYWSHYPSYWRPWRPNYWHYYYGYHFHWQYHYYSHYRRWNGYRVPGWHTMYYGSSFRSRSVVFQTRYRQGAYRTTYSRPQLAVQGSARFRRTNPGAPSVNNRLPNFDRNGRPVVVRPTNPTRPGNGGRPGSGTRPTNPGTRPGNGTRPVTRPTNPGTRPGNGTRPVTRPTNPTTRPGTRPTNPTTRPGTRPTT